MGPQVVGDGGAVLVVEVDGVHELAVDVELQLVVGAVAEPDRARAAVAVEVIQGLLRQVLPSVYPVHELQRPVGFGPLAARFQPVHEPLRLFREPDAQETVEGEGGVPDPGVAVVPVALPADALGQAHGGGCHYGARRLVGRATSASGPSGGPSRASGPCRCICESQRRQYSTVRMKISSSSAVEKQTPQSSPASISLSTNTVDCSS